MFEQKQININKEHIHPGSKDKSKQLNFTRWMSVTQEPGQILVSLPFLNYKMSDILY